MYGTVTWLTGVKYAEIAAYIYAVEYTLSTARRMHGWSLRVFLGQFYG
jgi:hypothetical protein